MRNDRHNDRHNQAEVDILKHLMSHNDYKARDIVSFLDECDDQGGNGIELVDRYYSRTKDH